MKNLTILALLFLISGCGMPENLSTTGAEACFGDQRPQQQSFPALDLFPGMKLMDTNSTTWGTSKLAEVFVATNGGEIVKVTADGTATEITDLTDGNTHVTTSANGEILLAAFDSLTELRSVNTSSGATTTLSTNAIFAGTEDLEFLTGSSDTAIVATTAGAVRGLTAVTATSATLGAVIGTFTNTPISDIATTATSLTGGQIVFGGNATNTQAMNLTTGAVTVGSANSFIPIAAASSTALYGVNSGTSLFKLTVDDAADSTLTIGSVVTVSTVGSSAHSAINIGSCDQFLLPHTAGLRVYNFTTGTLEKTIAMPSATTGVPIDVTGKRPQ